MISQCFFSLCNRFFYINPAPLFLHEYRSKLSDSYAHTCAQDSKGVGREGRIENFSSVLFPLCMHLCAHKTLKVEESKDARCKVEEKGEVKVEEE